MKERKYGKEGGYLNWSKDFEKDSQVFLLPLYTLETARRKKTIFLRGRF